ncbi:hypothetical protein [Phaeovulum sp. W22_SRMD_FR3]|uniref:hypothetical protein n=1 Tax=Phaeovulum sp. W22_SRMD_FR3 TaxID=3240274 RepID=UPI003F94BAAD
MLKSRHMLLPLLVPLALMGCNDPGFRGASGVQVVEAPAVASCTFLATVTMAPPTYGVLAQQGVSYARNKILDDARKAGATHAVFDPVVPGAPVYELKAQAYRC